MGIMWQRVNGFTAWADRLPTGEWRTFIKQKGRPTEVIGTYDTQKEADEVAGRIVRERGGAK